MHLHANNLDVAHFGGALVNVGDAIQRDTELIFARTGRDVFVRMRIDIGIDAQCDRRARFFCTRDAIDVFQFRFTLDIEAVNALLERVFDFLSRFAYAGERASWPGLPPAASTR